MIALDAIPNSRLLSCVEVEAQYSTPSMMRCTKSACCFSADTALCIGPEQGFTMGRQFAYFRIHPAGGSNINVVQAVEIAGFEIKP
jgi:hypothetical protein